MPGVYKLKSCPECKKEHRKKGIFCSQACSNSHREPTENQREQGRKLAEGRRGTPEAIAAGHLMKQGIIVNSENFAIQIPDIPELPEGYDIADKW
jgi:hypothetical protein